MEDRMFKFFGDGEYTAVVLPDTEDRINYVTCLVATAENMLFSVTRFNEARERKERAWRTLEKYEHFYERKYRARLVRKFTVNAVVEGLLSAYMRTSPEINVCHKEIQAAEAGYNTHWNRLRRLGFAPEEIHVLSDVDRALNEAYGWEYHRD